MVTARFRGSGSATVQGLTQWDYGQELEFAGTDVPDGTEVNFYQGLLTSLGYVHGSSVMIPDRMLQNADTIKAYVYVRSETAGETELEVYLPVSARPRPDNYVLKPYEEYKRLLPPGGETGQALVKREGDYAAGWEYRADNLRLIDGALQLMSGGIEIGERVRIGGSGGSSREIELRNNGEAIQWRYTDTNEWHVLAYLEDLRGPAGETPTFAIEDGHLYAIYQE